MYSNWYPWKWIYKLIHITYVSIDIRTNGLLVLHINGLANIADWVHYDEEVPIRRPTALFADPDEPQTYN